MTLALRLTDTPVVSRLELVHEWLANSLVPLDVRPNVEPGRMNDEMVTGQLGSVWISEQVVSPAVVLRTPKLIRRSDPEMCKIQVLVRGQLVFEQDGRQAQLRPGELSLVNLSRPCRWVGSDARFIAVMFPRAGLALSDTELAQLTATAMTGDRGTGALVVSLARQVVRDQPSYTAVEGAGIGTVMLDLFSVALATRLDVAGRLPPEGHQQALLMRIHAFIEQRLADPALSPATVAEAHHISVRYLHKLFETREISVSAWIRRRRLERCRKDLLDPMLRHMPVGAIGARWGFPDAMHFSRAFRATYDLPPSEYRRTHGARAAP